MITRACISINNRCNLNCDYCHFHTAEKADFLADRKMNIIKILDNITRHINKHHIEKFKLGFVGNGEPLLDYNKLKCYVEYINDYLESGRIAAYTVTNGTLVTREMLEFMKQYKVNVGFSLDGIAEIHNKLRCGSFNKVMSAIEVYREINGVYPSFNCTVGSDVLLKTDETIRFFSRFSSRVTFSRMIGKGGITLYEYRNFLNMASKLLDTRRGGYDCTMYGGMCGAGINNIFYANGKIYLCGNCIDLPPLCGSDTPLDEIRFDIPKFDRNCCYKEELQKNSCDNIYRINGEYHQNQQYGRRIL